MKLKTLALTTALVALPLAAHAKVDPDAVLTNYADIALAKFEDALTTAKALDEAIDAFVASPSAEAFEATKTAWLAARVPYQQTEVYRFGNAYVDEWEGKVNAWPLDEGMIDYVDASYGTESDENVLYTANIIANPTLKLGSAEIDAATITPALLADELHEADGVEANVATGYHAIEFLLWGQDLNGTGPGAGERPWTDYAKGGDCTGGNCARRAEYLSAASDLLLTDLEEIVAAWGAEGEARTALMGAGPKGGLAIMLTGLGSLSYGELAGERMKLGLLLNDPEEEHDCFADNTHNSHFYNIVGMQNIYSGTYTRIDGSTISGPGLMDAVKDADAGVAGELEAKLSVTREKA
ncbi:MAG: imelysin family protein, partial [Pseudomonadota bacterium]